MTTFNNAAPATPTGVTLVGGTKQITVKWAACDDYDYTGTLVLYSTSQNGTYISGGETKGTSIDITGLNNATAYWVQVAHFDSFGKVGLNYSTAISITTDNWNSLVDARIGTASINGSQLVGQSVPSTALSTSALYAPLAFIGDVRNLCRNPLGDRGIDGWTGAVIADTSIDWNALSSGLYKGTTSLIFDDRDALYGDYVPVTNGDQFWVNAVMVARGGGLWNYGCSVGVVVYNSAKAAIQFIPAVTGAAGSVGFKGLSGSCTISNTAAVYIKVWVQINKVAGTNTTGTAGDGFHISNIVVTRKNSGALIVDGTITGNHIAANSITASNINSNGLTIKDNAGNVLFGVGAPLNYANITASPGWLNTAVAQYGNVLTNTENSSNELPNGKGWNVGYVGIAGGVLTFITECIRDGFTYNWQPTGTNPFVIYESTANNPTSDYAEYSSDAFPVVPGQRFEFSAWVNTHRCKGDIYIIYYNNAGASVGATKSATSADQTNVGNNGQSPKDIVNWTRLGNFSTVPANASTAKILLRKWATVSGGANSYMWVLQPYCGIAGADQTVLSAYSPGGEWVPSGTVRPGNMITSSNVSTLVGAAAISTTYIANAAITTAKIANAAIGDAQVSTLSASKIDTRNLTVKDAAGNVILSAGVPLNYANITASAGWLNSNMAGGNNLLYNADFNNSTDGWNLASAYGFNVLGVGVNLNVAWQLAPVGAQGNSVYYIYQGASSNNNTYYNDFGSNFISVEPSKRYMVSVYSGSHRCKSAVYFNFYDAAGTLIGNSYQSGTCENNEEMAGGTALSQYKRIYCYADLPSNAAQVRVYLRHYDTIAGQTNSYSFFAKAQLEQVGSTATVPGPWVSGSQFDFTAIRAMNPITSGNITTYISGAAIGSAQIGNAAIGSAHIGSAAIGNAHISNLSVDTIKIANAAISNTTFGSAQGYTRNWSAGSYGAGSGSDLFSDFAFPAQPGDKCFVEASFSLTINADQNILDNVSIKPRIVIDGVTVGSLIEQKLNQWAITFHIPIAFRTKFDATSTSHHLYVYIDYSYPAFTCTGASSYTISNLVTSVFGARK